MNNSKMVQDLQEAILLTPTQNNSENETRLRLKQYPHEITHILSKSEAEPVVGST